MTEEQQAWLRDQARQLVADWPVSDEQQRALTSVAVRHAQRTRAAERNAAA